MFALPTERFGAYELNHKLGKGGMGEVWRATHRELHCERALKFPIERIAANRRWRAELLREARILVTLEHRNIATLFDFLDHDGRFAIVMEYVPGRTLAEVLREGPLPPRDAAAIMRQVGEALHYAHSLERPVIHRDLKPGNVMVRPDGVVKVLDWGLALAELESGGGAETPRAAATGGPILGTPGYMAPEQARGKLADARADIWAFGCILYECLTGHRAFPRALEDLAATIADQPDLAALPAAAPMRLRRLIERCLQKDARERPQSVQAILADLVDDDSTSEFAPPTGVPHNLAPALTSFVGRARELDRIRRLLADPQVRLLTLTGFGGCGKTRLALRVAEEAVQASTDQGRAASLPFPDGAWWIELASIADLSLIPQAIAAALTTTGEAETSGDPRAALLGRLRDKHALLVLDNCEHLVGACRDLVGELLQKCPKLRVLATSREPLGVAGEQHVDVLPMTTPPAAARVDLDALKQVDAVELFVRRVRLVQPDFELTEANAPIVAEVCRRLDGIPFAIELAAARTRSLSLDQIAARLDNVFVLLKKAAAGSTRPHATLEATIRWSYDMLDASQRSLLDQLLVFQGGWTLEAAEAVCEVADPEGRDVAELLGDLVEKSLVVFEQVNGWPRYRMLEAVRQFVEDTSGIDRTREHALQTRFVDYFSEFAHNVTERDSNSDQTVWLERVANDFQNLRQTLELCWSQLRGNLTESASRLSLSLSKFCYVRGFLTEGRRWLERAIAGRQATRDLLQLQLHNASGILAWRQNDFANAQRSYESAHDVARDMHDQPRLAGINHNIAVLAAKQGDFQTSHDMFHRAIAAYTSLGSSDGLAQVQLSAADAALAQGDLDEAERLLNACLPQLASQNDRLRIAAAKHNLGEVSRRRGNGTKARTLLHDSIAVRRSLGDHLGITESLVSLAFLAVAKSDHLSACLLLGYVEHCRAETHATATSGRDASLDHAIDLVKQELGAAAADKAIRHGRTVTEHEAIEAACGV